MDEDEYKSAYDRINSLRCVFEKAMTSLHGNCAQGRMFRLADRHGFGCQSPVHQAHCRALLDHLRQQTKFVFKLGDIAGPLPHNKEIRVQNGGLNGLAKLLDEHRDDQPITDVSAVIAAVIERYGSIENLPYATLMQAITAYQVSRRGPGKN
jgi:hypothetical protein